MYPPYQKLLRLSHVSWLSHSPVVDCTWNWPHLFLNVNTCCRITHDQSQLQWTMVLNLFTTYFKQFKSFYCKHRQFEFELELNIELVLDCFMFLLYLPKGDSRNSTHNKWNIHARVIHYMGNWCCMVDRYRVFIILLIWLKSSRHKIGVEGPRYMVFRKQIKSYWQAMSLSILDPK